MIKLLLVWIVVITTPEGQSVPGVIRDTVVFTSQKACDDFADSHSTRVEDWARGAVHAPWATKVDVKHKCEPAGDPA